MLQDMKEIEGYAIQAIDGKLGKVKSFYFDDQTGFVRYLVVDTGGWLPGRQVLIGPEALGEPNWVDKTLPVYLSKEQIENSPEVSMERPVSRQMETNLRDYYGWPSYWQMAVAHNPWQGMGPIAPAPAPVEITGERQSAQVQLAEDQDPHLRSSEEVIGYHIQAVDGEIGHLETFLVDDMTWRIQYLIVDTKNWLPGKKVLVAPEWISEFLWSEKKVLVDLQKDQIEASPEYDPAAPFSREYEANLYRHYGSKGYWMS
jgi:hypothetical protein